MSELRDAIDEMRDMRESFDQLASVADLYQQGRSALATAITAKGVPTTAETPLADMAENVGDIQQQTIEVTAPNWYGGQVGADGSLWDLYAVLAQMKNQYMGAGHYAALIVCEYYKGYDSLQLQGADAYYTCDGSFYNYDANHVWNDADNGKANRWVCFLYASEGARLNITNTAISPRSMYIGGHIGTIEYFVTGRLTDIVCGVEDTDIIDYFLQKGYTQSFGFNCILRGVKNFTNSSTTGSTQFVSSSAGTLFIETLEDYTAQSAYQILITASASFIKIKGLKNASTWSSYLMASNAATGIELPDLEYQISGSTSIIKAGNSSYLQYLYFDNLKSHSVQLAYPYGGGTFANLIDVKVGNMVSNFQFQSWNPTAVLADATKKAQLIDNIKNHILARVSDATGGTQLVCKVSTNMYNAIASENITWNGQTMTLADAFLTKNWLLAGA